MSGPKKDKVILSEQGVITQEALIAYVRNELSAEEKQELEKLLLQDPFAADALEGLQSSANQSAVVNSLSSLNKKVRQRSGLKERKKLQIHWVTYAWAAVLIGLLVAIGFIMINFLSKTDKPVAAIDKNEKQEAPATPPKDTTAIPKNSNANYADSSTALTGKTSDTVSAQAVKATPNGAITADVKSKSAAGTYAYTVTSANGLAGSATTVKAPDVKMPRARTSGLFDSVTSHDNKSTAMMQTSKPEAAKKEERVDVKDVARLQEEAMKNFNSADYNAAAEGFDKILKADPGNADALYFGGVSDYINGKTAQSENNFDKLLKGGSKYIEGSKWYKANILLKKGKSDAAKTLLQDLSNGNSSYKERAIKKLAEMGF